MIEQDKEAKDARFKGLSQAVTGVLRAVLPPEYQAEPGSFIYGTRVTKGAELIGFIMFRNREPPNIWLDQLSIQKMGPDVYPAVLSALRTACAPGGHPELQGLAVEEEPAP